MMPTANVRGQPAEDRSKCSNSLTHYDQNCRSGKGFLFQIHADGTSGSAHSRRRNHLQSPRIPHRHPFPAPSGQSKLPGELTAVALFRCLRLRSQRDGAGEDDELAYQTSMSIGGRKFKGVLYDQGPETCFGSGGDGGGASGGLKPTHLPPPFSSVRFLASGEGTDFPN